MAETGQSFIKKFVGFSLVTWVSFAISFLAAPISTRLFDPSVLGKINIFSTYTNFAGIFVLLGLDQAYARFFNERPCAQSVKYLFTFCVSITYSLVLLFVIVSIPIRGKLSYTIFQEEDNLLLWLFFISVFCSSTLRYLNLTYRMEQNIKMYTIQGILITLASKVLYISVGFWDPSYKPALVVLTLSHLALAVFFLGVQRNRFEIIKKVDRPFAKELFKFAIPLLPVTILSWANSSIPQIVMQRYMDYYSIGIFTSAMSLANLILIVQSGFNTFWVPYVYENYKEQTGQFYKVQRYLLCALTIVALLIISTQDVIFLILGEKYRAAKTFFPFLMLTPICYLIGETSGVGIDISKKTYLNLYVFGASVLTNFVLCVILQKWMGVEGIAVAVSVSAIVAMVLKTFLGEKYYHMLENPRQILFTITIIVSAAIATLLTTNSYLREIIVLCLLISTCFYYRREISELYQYGLTFLRK